MHNSELLIPIFRFLLMYYI